MKGLIIKDLLNLKKNFSAILTLVIFYAFIAYTSEDSSVLIGMITMMLTMMTITSIAYDDLAKWDKYALAMPISRKDIILSKYILLIMLDMIGIAISIVITFIITKLKGSDVNYLLIISYSIFAVSLIFGCIILPLIFKFGVEKSRLMMMGVFAVPVAVTYILYKMGLKLPGEEFFCNLLKSSSLLLLVVLFISYTISYTIYKKKDM